MSVAIVKTALGDACANCPDLDNDAERPTDPAWQARATCCRDDHTARRLAGDDRDWEGVARAREISDKEAAAGITPGVPPNESRQTRRRRERKGQK